MTQRHWSTELLEAPTLIHWNIDDSASLKHRKTRSTDTDVTEAPTMDISPITEPLKHCDALSDGDVARNPGSAGI
jgi:hypothetical protein